MSWLKNDILRSRIRDYTFEFDKTFEDDLLSKDFYKYLKANHNNDSYDFLKSTKKYIKLGPESNKGAALEIVDKFIRHNSPSEINVDFSSRTRIISTIENSVSQNIEIPSNVFDSVYFIVYRELRSDAFSRYIRSEVFYDFLQEKSDEYITQIAQFSDTDTSYKSAITFGNEDFCQTTITDKDIKLVLRLSEDSSSWQSIKSTKKNEVEKSMYGYISKKCYKGPDNFNIKLAKFTGILPCSAREAIYAMCDGSIGRKWDAGSVRCGDLGFIDNEQDSYSVSLHDHYASISKLLSHRSSVVMNTIVYDSVRKCYSSVSKTTNAFEEFELEGVKIKFYCGITFYEISENRCRYAYVIYIILVTKIHEIMFLHAMKKKAEGTHQGLLETIELSRAKQFQKPGGNFLKTLDLFEQRYPSKTWDINDL
ncbi:regulator of G-protein signaling [Acrasis kona]|uniref:Regulator of G-protein signaling n=1 Tax=Acrasis kona TaxID=1008807 RepID=A0AAW2Z4G1_9EUKA